MNAYVYDSHLIGLFINFRIEMRLASGGALIPKRAHGLTINPVVARNAKVLSIDRYFILWYFMLLILLFSS
jgi:hypothetical protein